MLPDKVFGVERGSLDPDNPEHVSTGPQGKPAWLISDLVDLNSLIFARKHHEWFVSKLPKDPTATEKRKAFHISKRFFQMVVDTLRKAREKSKVQMYEDGLYCLVNWEQEKWCSYDIPNPLLSFLWPEQEVISASAVPDTVTEDSEDVREANFELLETLISGRKEMLVEVTYDVLVSNEPTAHARKKDENKEKKPFRTIINILRISKSFLSGFCHLSEEDLLRTHPAMLQCMYRLALVIRDIFVSHINGARSNAARQGGASQRSVHETTQEDPAVPPSSALTTETANDNNQTANIGRNGDRAIPTERMSVEQQTSRTPTPQGEKQRDTGHRKETPPIDLEGLLPAESEMQRILSNHLELSTDAHEKLHVRREGESDVRFDDFEEQLNSEVDVEDLSDNGDDAMSDMLGDDEL